MLWPICERRRTDLEIKNRTFESDLRRKTLHKWTAQVRLTPAAAGGIEGPVDDGHSWRKYGQKHILGAKHPRSAIDSIAGRKQSGVHLIHRELISSCRAYYRCTYQNTQGCPAAKQVQRSDDDPLLFDVTYLGTHSCQQRPPKRPTSTPERKETKQSPTLLLSFQSELRVNPEALDAEEAPAESVESDGTTPAEISPLIGAWSPDFLTSPYPVSSLDESDSDFTDFIGRANSASDSSLVDMDFLLDELALEQSFQFDASGFFP